MLTGAYVVDVVDKISVFQPQGTKLALQLCRASKIELLSFLPKLTQLSILTRSVEWVAACWKLAFDGLMFRLVGVNLSSALHYRSYMFVYVRAPVGSWKVLFLALSF